MKRTINEKACLLMDRVDQATAHLSSREESRSPYVTPRIRPQTVASTVWGSAGSKLDFNSQNPNKPG